MKQILAELEATRDARIELVSGGRPRLMAAEDGGPRYLADEPLGEEDLMQLCRGLGAGRRVDGLDEAPAAWTFRTGFAVLKVSAVVNEGTMAVLVHRADAKPLPRATPERRRTTTAPRPPRTEARSRRSQSAAPRSVGSRTGAHEGARSALTQRLPRVQIGRVGNRTTEPPDRGRERQAAVAEQAKAYARTIEVPNAPERSGRDTRTRNDLERVVPKRTPSDLERPAAKRAQTERSMTIAPEERATVPPKRAAVVRVADADPFTAVLREGRALGATDALVLPQGSVSFRVPGRRVASKATHDGRAIADACLETAPGHARRRFRERGVTVFGAEREGGPLRVRMTKTHAGVAIDVRLLYEGRLDLEGVGAPRSIDDLSNMTDGLLLFVGAPCSGKTTAATAFAARAASRLTALAEIVAHPCEYETITTSGHVLLREVGVHVTTIAAGVLSAMRSRRDVIVAHLTDVRSARALLSAADAGHLVVATMNGDAAASCLAAIPTMFDKEEARWAERVLSNNLRAIVETALLRRAKQPGNVVAYGVAAVDDARRSAVRQGGIASLLKADVGGRGEASLARALAKLVISSTVTAAEACRAARDADLLMELVDEAPTSSARGPTSGSVAR